MKIADGVYVHFIPTQKYKTNRIVFRMTGSLNKQTIAKRALVSNSTVFQREISFTLWDTVIN